MKRHREVPRLALTRTEAAESLGMGTTSFDETVRPHVRAYRDGKLRLDSVDELKRWLDENSTMGALDDAA
jgi:hypothetical protein